MFIWYDYVSCPQLEPREGFIGGSGAADEGSDLAQAITSIPAYIGQCSFFFALCPVLTSQDGTGLLWIPSHGKQPGWQAENPEHTALARALNNEADVRCTAMLQPLRDGWQSACDCYDSAVDWGSAAVRAQHEATGPFHEMLKTAIGELRTS